MGVVRQTSPGTLGDDDFVVASTHPGRARSARVTGHVCRQLVSGDHLHHGLLARTPGNIDESEPSAPKAAIRKEAAALGVEVLWPDGPFREF